MPFNIFDGSTWKESKSIKVYDGTSWKDASAVYVYDGLEWKISGKLPVNTSIPVITSSTGNLYNLKPNSILTTSNGTWTENPTSYSYQWYKLQIGTSSWQAISGATNSSLTLTENLWQSSKQVKYVGSFIKCKVTALNSSGPNNPANPIYTEQTGAVLPADITDLTATCTQNDIVTFTWTIPVGANDFYMQYQGPGVSFTEITSLADHANTQYQTYSVNGNIATFILDTETADGTLGSLINPKYKNGSSSITGYGMNASVLDLKPNKSGVSISSSDVSTISFKINWSFDGELSPSEWILYDGSNFVTSSYYLGLSARSYTGNGGTGGSTFGAYHIVATGNVPRYINTTWTSPSISITIPAAPTPEPPAPGSSSAPAVSSTNGRVFTTTNGTWTNTDSISFYIYTWYANGVEMWGFTGSSIDLGTSTEYDGKYISSAVAVMTTDLHQSNQVSSNNSVLAVASGGGTTYNFTPYSFTPVDPPYNFSPGSLCFKSLGATTMVQTTKGLVAAHDLVVGDELVSADIETMPTSGSGLYSEWSAIDPIVTQTTTTITAIATRNAESIIIINGETYSDSHYIYAKRDNICKFINVNEILLTDLVFSTETLDWCEVLQIDVIPNVSYPVISINTEPYDIFYTERFLVHDSYRVDLI